MHVYIAPQNSYKIAKRNNTYYFIMGQKLTGYSVRESLKTNDYDTAFQRAQKRYDEYYQEYSTDLFDSTEKSFQNLANQFMKENTYPKHKEYMQRLYLPYFTKKIGVSNKIKDVSKITYKDIQNYLKYRRTLKTRAGTIVKNTTIKREFETLIQFFKWCYLNGYLKKPFNLPPIQEKETVRDENGQDIFERYDNSRDAFTDAEIVAIFNQYKSDIENTVNAYTKRRLILAYRYCKILFYTGCRTCDLRRVTWAQFEPQEDGSGIFHNFYSKKKKDRRDIALCPNTTKILLEMREEIEQFCQKHGLAFDTKNTPLFCLCNKLTDKEEYYLKPIKEFDSGFRKILKKCHIDGKGQKCLYSWRHHFITQKCMEGVPVLKIAAHCGTSHTMIEKYYLKCQNMIKKEELYIEPIAA